MASARSRAGPPHAWSMACRPRSPTPGRRCGLRRWQWGRRHHLVHGRRTRSRCGRPPRPRSRAARASDSSTRLAADGTSTSVADLAAFEVASNPDKPCPATRHPDSNLNGLAIAADGSVLVADAGGNDLLSVAGDGTDQRGRGVPGRVPGAASRPDRVHGSRTRHPAMIPMDPVPTSVAIGEDGTIYVGQLTGFPFPNGGASVFTGRSRARTRRRTRAGSPT